MYSCQLKKEIDNVSGYVADPITWTHNKIVLYNAGERGVYYPTFEGSSVEEVMVHIGTYMHKGLFPKLI